MSLFSPQVEDSEGTIQFDGEGYALVSRPIRWYPNISTVMFKFRTFSSNALLMYLATRDLVKICTADLSWLKICLLLFCKVPMQLSVLLNYQLSLKGVWDGCVIAKSGA